MHEEATVYCRDCGAQISERAEICPECGIRQKEPAQQESNQRREKDPGLAALASLIIPGAGQVYNGQIAKGIIGGVVTLVFAITMVGLVVAVPLWLYLIYDAYRTAQSLNHDSVQRHATRVDTDIDSNVITSSLEWLLENGESRGLTREVLRNVRKKDIRSLSKGDLRYVIESLDKYDRATNQSQNVDETRAELIQIWEQKAGETWEG
jgi:TM2 domain-containing membrane protein YozV